jgi:hypothetical protein
VIGASWYQSSTLLERNTVSYFTEPEYEEEHASREDYFEAEAYLDNVVESVWIWPEQLSPASMRRSSTASYTDDGLAVHHFMKDPPE